MKKILTTAILAGSTVASFAAITLTHTDGAFDTGVDPRTGTEAVAVQAGDVVVLMASTNKKTSIGTMVFSTNSADTLTHTNVGSVTSNNTNPDQWASYTTITTAGTFDFTLTAPAGQTPTLKWVAYVLHSDAGQSIELLDIAATDNFGLAPIDASTPGTLAFNHTYTWAGSRDATILEAHSAVRGDLTTTNGFTNDNAGGGRVVSSGTATGAGFTSAFILTTNNTTVTSSGVLGLAFSEVVPEPSSTALLGLGGLALIFRRRR